MSDKIQTTLKSTTGIDTDLSDGDFLLAALVTAATGYGVHETSLFARSLFDTYVAVPETLSASDPRERMASQLLRRGYASVDEILQSSYGEWPPKGLDIVTNNPQRVRFGNIMERASSMPALNTAENLRNKLTVFNIYGDADTSGNRNIRMNNLRLSGLPGLMGQSALSSTLGHEGVHILQGDNFYRSDQIYGYGAARAILNGQQMVLGDHDVAAQVFERHLEPEFQRAMSLSPKWNTYFNYVRDGIETQARIHQVMTHGYGRWGQLPSSREQFLVAMENGGLQIPHEVMSGLEYSPTIAETRLLFASNKPVTTIPANDINFAQSGLTEAGRYEYWTKAMPGLYADLIEMYGDGPGRARFDMGQNLRPELRAFVDTAPMIVATPEQYATAHAKNSPLADYMIAPGVKKGAVDLVTAIGMAPWFDATDSSGARVKYVDLKSISPAERLNLEEGLRLQGIPYEITRSPLNGGTEVVAVTGLYVHLPSIAGSQRLSPESSANTTSPSAGVPAVGDLRTSVTPQQGVASSISRAIAADAVPPKPAAQHVNPSIRASAIEGGMAAVGVYTGVTGFIRASERGDSSGMAISGANTVVNGVQLETSIIRSTGRSVAPELESLLGQAGGPLMVLDGLYQVSQEDTLEHKVERGLAVAITTGTTVGLGALSVGTLPATATVVATGMAVEKVIDNRRAYMEIRGRFEEEAKPERHLDRDFPRVSAEDSNARSAHPSKTPPAVFIDPVTVIPQKEPVMGDYKHLIAGLREARDQIRMDRLEGLPPKADSLAYKIKLDVEPLASTYDIKTRIGFQTGKGDLEFLSKLDPRNPEHLNELDRALAAEITRQDKLMRDNKLGKLGLQSGVGYGSTSADDYLAASEKLKYLRGARTELAMYRSSLASYGEYKSHLAAQEEVRLQTGARQTPGTSETPGALSANTDSDAIYDDDVVTNGGIRSDLMPTGDFNAVSSGSPSVAAPAPAQPQRKNNAPSSQI